jgi:hypothetical protein
MSEMEMKNAAETEEEFSDELSDEALDRKQVGICTCSAGPLYCQISPR